MREGRPEGEAEEQDPTRAAELAGKAARELERKRPGPLVELPKPVLHNHQRYDPVTKAPSMRGLVVLAIADLRSAMAGSDESPSSTTDTGRRIYVSLPRKSDDGAIIGHGASPALQSLGI